ncbi:hypothetical protein [Escherichia coli]|uniref:hypothetical protein n=1 Tax=Escherichia coli TaxID=562 RepID=UPI000BE88B6D|nr:hypothetical protein [Escherichia coli]
MMEITTKEFAGWLGIREGELIHKYQTTREYKGVELPQPLYQHTGKTRKFRYCDVVAFVEKLRKSK